MISGDEIGSVEIDIAFAHLAEARLQQAAPHIDLDPETIPKVVNKMARTTFKVIKEEFGNEDQQYLPERNIPIPGISVRASSDAGDVQKGKLVLKMQVIHRASHDRLTRCFQVCRESDVRRAAGEDVHIGGFPAKQDASSRTSRSSGKTH